MIKYILGSLIVLYIYNTYLAPISQKVRQSRDLDGQSKPNPTSRKSSGDFIDYEEIND
jgi:hypothetical protein